MPIEITPQWKTRTISSAPDSIDDRISAILAEEKLNDYVPVQWLSNSSIAGSVTITIVFHFENSKQKTSIEPTKTGRKSNHGPGRRTI